MTPDEQTPDPATEAAIAAGVEVDDVPDEPTDVPADVADAHEPAHGSD